MGGKWWTPTDDQLLRELVAAGKTRTQLAAALGRSVNSVAVRAQRLGAVKWTPDNDRIVLELADAGKTTAEIAAVLGFTRASVDIHARRKLGLLFGIEPIPPNFTEDSFQLRVFLWEKRIKPRLADPDDNGCVAWTGAVSSDGYGSLCTKHRSFAPHRVAMEVHIGQVLLPDVLVCHTCDNPSCCNPEHFFLGDDHANCQDKVLKGRHRKKFTVDQVKEIRAQHLVKSMTELALLYGVANSSMSELLRKITYKYI